MDEWLAPVYPGDTLRTLAEVITARRSRSKPDRGLLELAFRISNQKKKIVCSFKTISIIRRRVHV